MPKTLYRYILTEVSRVTAVSALALVLVMAFGAAIKPLSEGMLGADSLLKFVLFMAPSMLQYALPFAAAMGSTLVYLRMSQDNEVLACQASGVSSFRVVAPMLLLGAVLLVFLVALSGAVAPAFYRKAAQTARGDVVSAMVRKLSGGQAFVDEKSGVVLYANHAEVMDPPKDPPATQDTLEAEMAVKLTGVVVGQIDKKTGRMEGDMTASSAVGVIYRDTLSGDAVVVMRLTNPDIAKAAGKDGKGEDKGHFVRAGAIDRLWFELPNPVKDKVEFSSVDQLLKMWRDPGRFDAVRRRVDALAKAVAMEQFRRQIEEQSASGVAFKGPLGSEVYTLRAPKCEVTGTGEMKLAAQGGARVVVEHRTGAVLLRRFEAESGEIECDLDKETGEPVAKLKLATVRISDPRQPGVVSARPDHVFDALAPQKSLLSGKAKNVKEWIAGTAAAAARNPKGAVAWARINLIVEHALLRNKVVAQFHVRSASAIACLLLALLGALMSLWRRGSLPLVVYFWCFLVAIVSVILINVGGNMSKDGRCTGLVLAWTPIVFQAGLAAWILHRLRKPGI